MDLLKGKNKGSEERGCSIVRPPKHIEPNWNCGPGLTGHQGKDAATESRSKAANREAMKRKKNEKHNKTANSGKNAAPEKKTPKKHGKKGK